MATIILDSIPMCEYRMHNDADWYNTPSWRSDHHLKLTNLATIKICVGLIVFHFWNPNQYLGSTYISSVFSLPTCSLHKSRAFCREQLGCRFCQVKQYEWVLPGNIAGILPSSLVVVVKMVLYGFTILILPTSVLMPRKKKGLKAWFDEVLHLIHH